MASSGTHISGAWKTPRTSRGSKFATPPRGMTCRSGANKCSSAEGKSDWGNSQRVPGEHLGTMFANQVHSKQSYLVGQDDAYGAIVTKVEVSTRSNGVYGIGPHACRGVMR